MELYSAIVDAVSVAVDMVSTLAVGTAILTVGMGQHGADIGIGRQGVAAGDRAAGLRRPHLGANVGLRSVFVHDPVGDGIPGSLGIPTGIVEIMLETDYGHGGH